MNPTHCEGHGDHSTPGEDGWEPERQMLPLHAQTGLPLLLMPATCSGKAESIPKVYCSSTELILIYSADPAFGSSETNFMKTLKICQLTLLRQLCE